MKTKVKFIITFAVIILAMCLFNINEVKAAEVDENYLNNLVNMLPSSMNLDIQEVDFKQVPDLALKNVEQILKDNQIQCSRVSASWLFNEGGLKIDNTTINGYDLIITICVNPNSGKEQMYNTQFNIYATDYKTIYMNYSKSKDVKIKYNNTDKYNSDDENYVKNLKITSPLYYEVSLDWLNKVEKPSLGSGSGMHELIENYYNNLINDKSIIIKSLKTAGGYEDTINYHTFECGTQIAIFKNGVLYDIRIMGNELTIPVINVPSNIEESQITNYVSNLITKEYTEIEGKILSITKGGFFEGKIPNVYTVEIKDAENPSYIIIRKETKEINIKDTTTKIKLEADTSILPENTQIESTKIENYTNTMLTNTNKFYAYDITLKSNGVKIQPNGKVKISIPIPEGMETSNLVVYRVEDNKLIKYEVTVEEIESVKYATFETDHFSTCVLAEVATADNQEENNTATEENTTSTNGEKDNTPKTGTTIIDFILEIIANIGKIIKI